MKCEFLTGTDCCNIYAWTCDYDCCSSNYDCPMKKLIQKFEKIEELCKNQDILRGRQALATKVLQIISEVENER